MKKSKVLTDFSTSKYNDKDLVLKARWIYDKMTDNTSFPTPDPSLETLKTATDEFEAALEKTEDGTHEDTVIKNQKRGTLEDVMHELAEYVQITGKGDEAVNLSSGFDTAKSPTATGPLPKATNVTINMGANKGSVILCCDPIKNVKMYVFEYHLNNGNEEISWSQVLNTKRKLQIDNLTSGKEYIFRIAGAGTDPSRNYSDEISSFVL